MLTPVNVNVNVKSVPVSIVLAVAVVAGLMPAGAAHAQAAGKKAQWVALIQVRGDAPASWSDALRAAAEAEGKDRTWVPPPAVSIADAQLALGCTGWNDQCAGQIASMTGAAMALVVDVNGSGRGVDVSVMTVKAGGGAVEKVDTLSLAGKNAADLELAKELIRSVLRGQTPSWLFLDTDVPKAEVWLDGEKIGETPFRGSIKDGDHTVVLRQEGKAPVTIQFSVKPGQTYRDTRSLGAAGPAVEIKPEVAPDNGNGNKPDPLQPENPPPPPAAEAPSTTTVGWSLVGVGGALGLAGVVFLTATAVDVTAREPCDADPVNGCLPSRPMLFGIYATNQRGALFEHQAVWFGGSAAALGVGGLLVATGVMLAVPPDEDATPPPPPGAVGR